MGNEDAVTDYNIDVNANGDVFFSTFDGNDAINVSGNYSSSDIIRINAGEGDNNIYVDDNSDNASVFITVGDGDNNINIDGAGDVTITAGDGDTDLYIDGEVEGDVSVTLGAGDSSIVIDANSQADAIELTLGGGDDEVTIDDALDLNNNVVVEIADFDVGDDVLFVDDNTNFNSTDYSLAIVGNAQNAIDVSDTVANIEVIEFAYEAVGGDYDFAEEYADGNLDGAMLFEALGLSADLVITTDANEDGFIIAYNSGDAYLFAYASDANGTGVNTVIDATEVSLVAILGSVEVGTLTADNFGF